MLKIIYKGLSISLVTVFLIVGVWYTVSFLPYKHEIIGDIDSGKNQLNGNSSVVYDLAIAAESKSGLSRYAAKGAYYNLSYKHLNKPNNTKWHLNQVLWQVAMIVHFSKQDIFYLWVLYSKMNGLAIQYFEMPILQLPFDKQAQIVSMVKAPKLYLPESERGNQRLRWVLDRYNDL